VPVSHLHRLAEVARRAGRHPETLVIDGGQHSWLYEFPEYRRAVAAFLATTLGGPLPAEAAGELAAAADARRLPDSPRPETAVQREPGGFRSIVALVLPFQKAGQGIGDVEEAAGLAEPPAADRADGETRAAS